MKLELCAPNERYRLEAPLPPAGSFAKESPNPPMPFCVALRQGSRLEVGGPRQRLVNITWLTFGLKGDTTIVHL